MYPACLSDVCEDGNYFLKLTKISYCCARRERAQLKITVGYLLTIRKLIIQTSQNNMSKLSVEYFKSK